MRKQARLLENDIDVKLVAFSKLGMSSGPSGLSSESVPLISSEDMFDTMSMELQQLLNKVSTTISLNAMSVTSNRIEFSLLYDLLAYKALYIFFFLLNIMQILSYICNK